MKRIILPLLIFIITGSALSQTYAQDTSARDTTKKFQVTDYSLKGQYQALVYRSKSYYGAKLITPARLAAYYRSVTDSIKKERALGKSLQSKLKAQSVTIDTLNAQIKSSEGALASSNSRLDDINFLGMSFSKSTYNTLVWSLILILALALTFVIIRSGKNIHEARHRTELYEDISKEYQAYKTKANDKEKKLARELQDERNKLDEYKNRGL